MGPVAILGSGTRIGERQGSTTQQFYELVFKQPLEVAVRRVQEVAFNVAFVIGIDCSNPLLFLLLLLSRPECGRTWYVTIVLILLRLWSNDYN